MRIVVDAMGGDRAPEVVVEGAVQAARDFGVTVILVGPEEVVQEQLARHDVSRVKVEVVHAPTWVRMDEQPATAVRRKPDNSMSVGMRLLKEGKGDAFVTCGHTGAALAAALFTLGRIPGVKRPALTTRYPTRKGFCFILDIGANADCKPEYLQQFAVMGAVYAHHVYGVPQPKVGLLSIGEEAGKGNTLVQEAFGLLERTPGLHFIGNVEPKEVLAGEADVVVTDGFTGNVFIKTSEAVAAMLVDVVKEEVRRRPLALAGALLAQGAFRATFVRLDPREYGGAPMLGINGLVIVGHGRSDAYAVRNAVRAAIDAVRAHVLDHIREGLKNVPLTSTPAEEAVGSLEGG